MKVHALILVCGSLLGAMTMAQAQPTAPTDPLSDLQGNFGTIVGDAFRRPDPYFAPGTQARSAALDLGSALRTSIEVPGAVFAGVMKPFADAPDVVAPASVAPRHRVRSHHRQMASRN